MDKFNYTNSMQIPKLDKIVINMGLGDAVSESKKADIAIEALGLIAGQEASLHKSKKINRQFQIKRRYGDWYKSNTQKIQDV